MSVNLQYNYAHINTETGLCDGCMTFSYSFTHLEWVEVPTLGDYVGKYYNQTDGKWYSDSEFTVGCPELDW